MSGSSLLKEDQGVGAALAGVARERERLGLAKSLLEKNKMVWKNV